MTRREILTLLPLLAAAFGQPHDRYRYPPSPSTKLEVHRYRTGSPWTLTGDPYPFRQQQLQLLQHTPEPAEFQRNRHQLVALQGFQDGPHNPNLANLAVQAIQSIILVLVAIPGLTFGPMLYFMSGELHELKQWALLDFKHKNCRHGEARGNVYPKSPEEEALELGQQLPTDSAALAKVHSSYFVKVLGYHAINVMYLIAFLPAFVSFAIVGVIAVPLYGVSRILNVFAAT